MKKTDKLLPAEWIDTPSAEVEQAKSQIGYTVGRIAGRLGVIAASSLLYSLSRKITNREKSPQGNRKFNIRQRRRRMR